MRKNNISTQDWERLLGQWNNMTCCFLWATSMRRSAWNLDSGEVSLELLGIAAKNNNWQRLLERCAEDWLCITNTVIDYKVKHRASWISADEAKIKLRDSVVVNRARRSSVLDIRVYRRCKVPSDHKLVVSQLRIKLKAHMKADKSKMFDVAVSK